MPTVAPVKPASPLTDRRVMGMWLKQYESPCTQRAYEADAERFLAFIEPHTLPTVDAETIQAWASTLTGKSSSRARSISVVKSLLRFALDLDYIDKDYARFLKRPKIKDQMVERILPEADILAIIQAAPPFSRDHLIMRVMYATGCRVAELRGLTWKDVKPRDEGTLQLALYGKGGKTRHVMLSNPVTCKMLLTLRHGREDHERIFESRKGGRLTREAIHRMIKKYAHIAGIDGAISCHWFRHAHASHALDHGASLVEVRDTLGHSSIATTSRYLHSRPDSSSGRVLAI